MPWPHTLVPKWLFATATVEEAHLRNQIGWVILENIQNIPTFRLFRTFLGAGQVILQKSQFFLVYSKLSLLALVWILSTDCLSGVGDGSDKMPQTLQQLCRNQETHRRASAWVFQRSHHPLDPHGYIGPQRHNHWSQKASVFWVKQMAPRSCFEAFTFLGSWKMYVTIALVFWVQEGDLPKGAKLISAMHREISNSWSYCRFGSEIRLTSSGW